MFHIKCNKKIYHKCNHSFWDENNSIYGNLPVYRDTKRLQGVKVKILKIIQDGNKGP